MNVFELAIDWLGIYFRAESHNHLTEEHKFYIIMALIGLTAFLGFFGMIAVR